MIVYFSMSTKKRLVSAVMALIFVCTVSSCSLLPAKKMKLTPFLNTKGRVVLDAGHGGDDAGAVGANGTKEKDLTLALAKRLKWYLAQVLPNVEVVLTREQDRYVGLEERVKIANSFKGDLFLSLHINSNDNREASGFEIYSLDVASDRHAERLAARENTQNKGSRADLILADLRAHSHRAESDRLARNLVDGIKMQTKKYLQKKMLNDRGYNQAIFHVLFVDMPSVLAELFFVSNPEEEKLLNNPKFREVLVRGLVSGIKSFLDQKNSAVAHESQG